MWNGPETGSSGRTLTPHGNSSAFIEHHEIIQRTQINSLLAFAGEAKLSKMNTRSFPMLGNIRYCLICQKLDRVQSGMDSMLLLGKNTPEFVCLQRQKCVCNAAAVILQSLGEDQLPL